MKYLGIEYKVKNLPELDTDFIPMGAWFDAYLAGASHPVAIAVERNDGKITVRRTKIYNIAEMKEADYKFIERFVKFLLWSIGGFRVYITGADEIAKRLKREYVYFENDEEKNGRRWFDVQFMGDVFGRGFEIVACKEAELPKENDDSVRIGGHMDGCRIGLDVGGSDRKVSAVVDGETVYSEEVVWHPKTATDPQYHYDEIVKALKTAADKMPRVDGIGVSSAGVFIGNAPMVSSLFISVPREKKVRELVHTVFDRAACEVGDVPIVVANDGDVTALAGAMSLDVNNVMGLAMGTSEAVGYVDGAGNILGWFNELAFAPVDLNEKAMEDEWSHDRGVGCKYFSQDAVIKLAPKAGVKLDDNLTPAEKLVVVQDLMAKGDGGAEKIFRSIGCYLAHTINLYDKFYDLKYLMVLGRVVSGKGGDIVIKECNRILKEEYPEIAKKVTVMLPNEKARRVGQSIAAASLPEIRK
ncbi:ROK family protein [Candidatus Saccharibacteria bacterium]|nr:ROK family protein [Candidatus Saccharibacteria bacterium]